MPLSSLRSLLTAAPVSTVRLILQYYSRNKQTLHVRPTENLLDTLEFVLLCSCLGIVKISKTMTQLPLTSRCFRSPVA